MVWKLMMMTLCWQKAILGFTTYEVGEVKNNKMILTLKDIGRISFSRDLPVEDVSSLGANYNKNGKN
jgi:hypothetical protein